MTKTTAEARGTAGQKEGRRVRNVLDDLSIQKGKPQAKRRGSRWSYAETPGLRGSKGSSLTKGDAI